MTHTYAVLEIDWASYEDIKRRILHLGADYRDMIDDGHILLDHLALTIDRMNLAAPTTTYSKEMILMPNTNTPAVGVTKTMRGAVIRDSWRCPQDGQINFNDTCTNCGQPMPADLAQPDPLPTIRALHAKFHNWLLKNRGGQPPGVPTGTPAWLALSMEDVEKSEAALAALLASKPQVDKTRNESALTDLRKDALISGN